VVTEYNSSSVIKIYCICCVNHELLKAYANCTSTSYILLPYARYCAGNQNVILVNDFRLDKVQLLDPIC